MSPVSELMRNRAVVHAHPPDCDTLDDLGPERRARVIGYGSEVDPSAARRLFDLGLAPGVEVVMVRRAPLRDPVIYRVGDYEIALRRQQARCVRVETVA